MILILTC